MLFLVHLVKMRHSGSSSQCSALQQQQQQSFAPELPFLHRLAHTYTVQAIARLLLVLKQHDQLSVSIDSISANHRHVQGFAIEQVLMLMIHNIILVDFILDCIVAKRLDGAICSHSLGTYSSNQITKKEPISDDRLPKFDWHDLSSIILAGKFT